MKVLVINCGSSSLKYDLFAAGQERPLASGLAERLGTREANLAHEAGASSYRRPGPIPDHNHAVEMALDLLDDRALGVVGSRREIAAVGHRVVHGGERFSRAIIIDGAVLGQIEDCIPLAPLHNPANLAGIRACQQALPWAPQVAVFDTAFHQTLPEHAYLYGLPYELYSKYGLRKYGFHGSSHQYVCERAAELLGRPLSELRLVSAHLGNGASTAAVAGGRCVDTSMGFTPLDGLLMGTRCGALDPAVVGFLMRHEGLDWEGVEVLLNQRCGLLGLSGVSRDMREVLAAAHQGNRRAQLAVEVFCYRVRMWVGAHAAAMGGVEALIFTAGIGENSPEIRARCTEGLGCLGLTVDDAANARAIGTEADISASESGGRVLVVPTNEELMIVREVLRLCAHAEAGSRK